jgi:hypothetical protein
MEELLAPDFEVDATDRVLNPDRYVGLEGFRRLASEMFEIWDSWLMSEPSPPPESPSDGALMALSRAASCPAPSARSATRTGHSRPAIDRIVSPSGIGRV